MKARAPTFLMGETTRSGRIVKPPLLGSSDPAFRGDFSRYNPEELLVAALSSCHMLSYLHLCAVNGVRVVGSGIEPKERWNRGPMGTSRSAGSSCGRR